MTGSVQGAEISLLGFCLECHRCPKNVLFKVPGEHRGLGTRNPFLFFPGAGAEGQTGPLNLLGPNMEKEGGWVYQTEGQAAASSHSARSATKALQGDLCVYGSDQDIAAGAAAALISQPSGSLSHAPPSKEQGSKQTSYGVKPGQPWTNTSSAK